MKDELKDAILEDRVAKAITDLLQTTKNDKYSVDTGRDEVLREIIY